tara:strand:- start:470 stop:709 length:240 start_codon:yes stop_codon:yes gene_type:complete
MNKHGDRYGLNQSIVKVRRALEDAAILFSVMDELLLLAGDDPVLPENRVSVNARFQMIRDHLQEVVITLAEDKHGRVRR